jgi:hypothetical protein
MVKKLCQFIDIPFDDSMSNPKMGQYSSITGERREGFDKESAYRWRKEILPFEKLMMSVLTRSSMRRFGYEIT